MHPRIACVVIALAGLSASPATTADAQDIKSLLDFDGHESWPLLTPEQMSLNPARLRMLQATYEFQTRRPDGDERWNSANLVIDVRPVSFQAKPAHLIQWTVNAPKGTAAIDALWVDASSFRILQRIAAAGPGTWGGSYNFTQHHPDKTISIRITDQGEVPDPCAPGRLAEVRLRDHGIPVRRR